MAAVTLRFEPWSTQKRDCVIYNDACASTKRGKYAPRFHAFDHRRGLKAMLCFISLWSPVCTPVWGQLKAGELEWCWSWVRHSTSARNFSLAFKISQNEYTLTMNLAQLSITSENYFYWTATVKTWEEAEDGSRKLVLVVRVGSTCVLPVFLGCWVHCCKVGGGWVRSFLHLFSPFTSYFLNFI